MSQRKKMAPIGFFESGSLFSIYMYILNKFSDYAEYQLQIFAFYISVIPSSLTSNRVVGYIFKAITSRYQYANHFWCMVQI